MRIRTGRSGGGVGAGVNVAVVLAVMLATVLAPLGASVAFATHENERTTDGFKGYTPGGEIPNPGENYTVELYMTPSFMEDEGPIPSSVEVRVDYVVYYSTTISQCEVDDTYVLGIDRGNDDPGTATDKDMVENLMANDDYQTDPSDDPALMTTNDAWDHRQVTWLEFPKEDDFIDPLYLHEDGVEDELIVASEDCVEMPEPGWHRTFGYLNGTVEKFHGDRDHVTIDGERYEAGDHFEIWEPSLWYPVCHCEESRHVSMRLDPPPGEMTRGSSGGRIHPNGTMEAPYAEVKSNGRIVYDDGTEVPPENVTSEGIHFHDGYLELNGPIYYAEGHVEADGTIVTPGGERIEPDEDEAPEPPTPTPTSTPVTEDPDGTPTPTLASDPGTGTPASTPTPTADEPRQQLDDGTPTLGEGDGFGPAVVVLALLLGAARLRRGGRP